MTQDAQAQQQDIKETGRIEAFSDGVFAIVVTLMAFEIRVPSLESLPENGGLIRALVDLWPVYLGFLISFTTICIMWINHHALFKAIKRSDQTFMLLNGLLLMLISLVPFSTLLLAEYLQHEQASIAAIVYSGVFFVIAIAFNLLWFYAAGRGRLLDQHADGAFVKGVTRQYILGPALYLLSMGLAVVSIPASLAIHFLLAAYFAVPGLAQRLGR